MHPYTNMPDDSRGGGDNYMEAFGEKFRALAGRTRPRDFYDVIKCIATSMSGRSRPAFADVLREKCTFKDIEVPRCHAVLSRNSLCVVQFLPLATQHRMRLSLKSRNNACLLSICFRDLTADSLH
jgi:hypothetical protein